MAGPKGTDRKRLEQLLARSRRWIPDDEAEALRLAHRLGADGDALFAAALTSPRANDVLLAAMLGDLAGPAGDEALARVVGASGPNTMDLRCAALLALAKRRPDGAATPTFVEGLASRSGWVKDYALISLAGAGDARGWQPAFDVLRSRLSRPSSADIDRTWWATAYLAQFPDEPVADLVALLRKRWDRIAHALIVPHWPEVAPDGPPADQVEVPPPGYLRAVIRADPLFSPWV
jgi:hypothetical protein